MRKFVCGTDRLSSRIKRALSALASLLFLSIVATGAAAAAEQSEADLALVLAVDVSSSVSTERWELQKQGYAAAFRSREIMDAIANGGPAGVIAVTLVEWSGAIEQRQVIGWTLLGDVDSAHSFAAAIAAAPRVYAGSTSISGAIDFSVELLQGVPFAALRRVVDVSGDGSSNDGRPASQARDEAAARRITINGLPILGGEANVDGYYREQVIGGPGAFVVVAQDYTSFAAAVLKKLVLEIAWLPLEGGRGTLARSNEWAVPAAL
jgi:Protein of unknown function (DUF1194)